MHNQVKICAHSQIANIFNEYYIELPKRVIKDAGNRTFEPTYNKCQNSLFLPPTSPDGIMTIIYGLKNKTSAGLGDISNILLRKIAHNIAIPLAHAINLSLERGIFPDVLKPSKVIPLFKAGDTDDVSNFRPLTLSSNIAKIYEKVYFNALNDFLAKNDIIAKEQLGFQKGKSTNQAIAKAIEHITFNLNTNSKVIGLFIDMSKAFDCVDHNKLLKILENYGIRGTALKWIESYLADRKQCVELTNLVKDTYIKTWSSFLNIMYGVPQGSILGPILFLLYINELRFIIANKSKNCYPILYADDNIIITGKSSDSTNELTEDMLNEVISYLQKLNLIVNTSKTSVMLFEARAGGYIPDVNVNGCRIPNVTTTKFLGVYIDSNLSWESHISELCGKLRKNVFLLRQLSQTVDKTTLIQCYYAFINSILSSGNLVWGGAVASHIKKVFSLQKSAVR